MNVSFRIIPRVIGWSVFFEVFIGFAIFKSAYKVKLSLAKLSNPYLRGRALSMRDNGRTLQDGLLFATAPCIMCVARRLSNMQISKYYNRRERKFFKMSVTLTTTEQISRSPVNRSTAKQLFSFSRGPRFQPPRKLNG